MSRVRKRKDRRVPPSVAAAYAGCGDGGYPPETKFTAAEVIELRDLAERIRKGRKDLARDFINKLDDHNFYGGYRFDDLVAWYEWTPHRTLRLTENSPV